LSAQTPKCLIYFHFQGNTVALSGTKNSAQLESLHAGVPLVWGEIPPHAGFFKEIPSLPRI
jgi:hypothetical protein